MKFFEPGFKMQYFNAHFLLQKYLARYIVINNIYTQFYCALIGVKVIVYYGLVPTFFAFLIIYF